jgi:hypothetical protein
LLIKGDDDDDDDSDNNKAQPFDTSLFFDLIVIVSNSFDLLENLMESLFFDNVLGILDIGGIQRFTMDRIFNRYFQCFKPISIVILETIASFPLLPFIRFSI